MTRTGAHQRGLRQQSAVSQLAPRGVRVLCEPPQAWAGSVLLWRRSGAGSDPPPTLRTRAEQRPPVLTGTALWGCPRRRRPGWGLGQGRGKWTTRRWFQLSRGREAAAGEGMSCCRRMLWEMQGRSFCVCVFKTYLFILRVTETFHLLAHSQVATMARLKPGAPSGSPAWCQAQTAISCCLSQAHSRGLDQKWSSWGSTGVHAGRWPCHSTGPSPAS